MIGNRVRNKRIETAGRSGFTLIEIMVALMIFSMAIVAISGVYVTGVRGQRLIISGERSIDQSSYALEYMSRALRMAKKQTSDLPNCLAQDGDNFELTAGGSSLRFINSLEGYDCQRFYLANGQLMQEKGLSTHSPQVSELTSASLEMTRLAFNVIGGRETDNLQPRVTISMVLRLKSGRQYEDPLIKVQTTVSQRNLDVRY
ncbi:MAG: prepilin-type N-terminal cleavage/methylation domain-containing protein [bacterium]